LGAAPPMPVLDAVLVNPGRPLSTAAVYRAFDTAGGRARADAPAIPKALASARAVVDFLRGRRNDLEAPAIALEPLVGEVLAALEARPEALMARMSGSGATCFGLCAGTAAAERLADALKRDHPSWWVRRCGIGEQSMPPPG
ncbi:MAG: 4-(cytidine 5'-diphospho)-2-C-methyl-D-erythritol kinase, partial [Caulobacteraceae bacterium]|nr:4-(cytidine 5'-diphospho)-2-C-methyl-D-erythritol kinase [Caulobacteraceae bacterium]